MAKLLNNEYAKMSFKAYKQEKENKRNRILTVIFSLLSLRGYGGSGTTAYEFILTDDNLYIDNIGYDISGQLEVLVTEKLARNDMKSFDVVKLGEEELITIVKNNNKKLIYVRDNKDSLDLALKMAEYISKKG